MATSSRPSARDAETIFSRVLVGIDGSPEALEAARQAAALAKPDTPLTLVSAWHLAPPVVTADPGVPAYDNDETGARRYAEDALDEARAELPTAQTRVVQGLAPQAVVDELSEADATLVAVGSHGQRRVEGILFGSTATRLVHDAPCSVLVARAVANTPPRRLVVGVDGSPQSRLAFAVAGYLGQRFGAEVAVVAAEGEKTIDLPAVSLIVGDDVHVVSEEPVDALTAASADADLLVLGSRGLHGLRALGSVSERVAHRAACSTLIVR